MLRILGLHERRCEAENRPLPDVEQRRAVAHDGKTKMQMRHHVSPPLS
jgi:hypothetical protein